MRKSSCLLLLLLNSCMVSTKSLMKEPLNIKQLDSELSYYFSQEKRMRQKGCSEMHLNICYKEFKKSFKIVFPRISNSNIDGHFDIISESFNGSELTFAINVSGPSATGYLLNFNLGNDSIQNPIVNYTSYSINGDFICYSKPVKVIDFCKEEYADSCYYIQKIEREKRHFSVKYSDFDNSANILIISADTGSVNNIEVYFPSRIISYIPEEDFALLYTSEGDTVKTYFSLHSDSQWFIDSTKILSNNKTTYSNTELMIGYKYLVAPDNEN